MSDFQNPTADLASSNSPQNLNLREDWVLFRALDGLTQKAGVSLNKLARLAMKELIDNSLDARDAHGGDGVDVGTLPNGGYYVDDKGPGIDGSPMDIAWLFSVRRPMASSKYLRLPTRGAVGNGLRVVAGAVLASGGSLTVTTRNQRIELSPQRDGSTAVVGIKTVKRPVGVRIEISFGPDLPYDANALGWARQARKLAQYGSGYSGKSSPWWYDGAQFHELLDANGDRPVRDLISQLDGCTGNKAGEIVTAAGLNRATCRSVTRTQAGQLLRVARDSARRVKPKRLGAVGPDAFAGAYACAHGVGEETPITNIPFVVEAWAEALEDDGDTSLSVYVNRTPVTGNIYAAHDRKDIDFYGCGLGDNVAVTTKDARFEINLNIITPFMPITSDGKEPDLDPFLDAIKTAVGKVVRKAHRPNSKGESQKDVVLDNLDDVIATVSGDGEYRFNSRQLFYALRPIVMDEINEELKIGNFTNIITDYEDEYGEIDGMYREPRGSITHPHRNETITLGTLMVESYERPVWNFNKIMYIEKEGANEALKDVGWLERHDCAVISSKGYSTRAARDLIDKLAEHDEPVTGYAVTDADAYGSMIYQTFQEATKARGARKVKIVHLGLHPWEAIAMGLEVETVEVKKNKEGKEKRKPVADYVLERDLTHPDEAPGCISWEDWLQTHRVELNAMTTPQFIEWLDAKMAAHKVGKLVPPAGVLTAELDQRIKNKVRATLTERILREAGLEQQVTAAIAKIKKPSAAALAKGIKQSFKEKADREWRDHIEAEAKKRTLKI